MDTVYFNVGTKLIAGFIVVVIYINLSGKGSLAPISALDQVGNLVLGAIIGGPLYNPNISVFMLVIVASMWAGLLLLMRYLSFKHQNVKDVVDGRSVCLMRYGKLLTDNFVQARLSLRDFIMLLHQRGYNNLDELKDVWFEYNGQMTVVKKGEDAMAIVLIDNGHIDESNLERMDFDLKWLMQEIARLEYPLEKIFCAEWHSGKLWIYPFQDKVIN